jgi:hypothetical protein
MIFRYVPHERVLDYLLIGWHIGVSDLGHHSNYAVLLRWLCTCKPVEPHYGLS